MTLTAYGCLWFCGIQTEKEVRTGVNRGEFREEELKKNKYLLYVRSFYDL